MKNRLIKAGILCLLLLVLAVVPVYAADFSCYTYDTQEHRIDSYWDETDDTWYLFVTSSQDISETVIHYTGSISSVTNGVLDTVSATISGAFAQSGDSVTVTADDGTVHRIVAMQSALPSVYIDLEDTTLDDIHVDKDKKHKGNSIYITDPNGTYNLTVENSLEIKGRGNSTWAYFDKKAYQIKFDDKTSVLGMGKAKKWVLLANAGDDSMIRTHLVYEMAEQMDMDFVCDMKFVDVWIEGEYRGTYQLGEKVELGSSRLNLSQDTGVLIEQDDAYYMYEDYWFYSESLGRHFVMKEIVEEDDAVISTAMENFAAAVDTLSFYLYVTPPENVTLEALSTMIDVESFAKYYLINEYVLNRESFFSSFYWYMDGPDDVLHLGPIWDFDTCMGNDGVAYTETYGEAHTLFRYLMAAPAFCEKTEEMLELYQAELDAMTGSVDVIQAQIADSAEMNYIRWDVLGKPNPKDNTVAFLETFDEACDAVETWLTGRADAFAVKKCEAVTSVVANDCSEMELCFWPTHTYNNVRFAVWSAAGDQDDVQWYTASQDESGKWQYTVDLRIHGSAGLYMVHVYADSQPVAAGHGYVNALPAAVKSIPMYRLYSEISGEHLYTGSVAERDLLVEAGWLFEGLAWYAPETGAPVYRLYSPISGDHHYTVSTEEVDTLKTVGWIYEGVAWSTPESGVPVYRLYSPYLTRGSHHYTTSEEERDMLANVGWIYEGIGWYASEPVR